MVKFVQKIMSMPKVGKDWDPAFRRSATEEYRQAVLDADRAGIGTAITWHTLAVRRLISSVRPRLLAIRTRFRSCKCIPGVGARHALLTPEAS